MLQSDRKGGDVSECAPRVAKKESPALFYSCNYQFWGLLWLEVGRPYSLALLVDVCSIFRVSISGESNNRRVGVLTQFSHTFALWNIFYRHTRTHIFFETYRLRTRIE